MLNDGYAVLVLGLFPCGRLFARLSISSTKLGEDAPMPQG